MEAFPATLRGRCVVLNSTIPAFGEGMASMWCSDLPSAFHCSDPGHTCDSQYGNPKNGQQSFDNFWAAFGTVFQLSTSSNWAVIADSLRDASSEWSPALFYPVWLIVVVDMVMINVVLAVIQFSFGQLRQHERMQDDEAQRRVAEEWALHHSTPCPGSVEMAAALAQDAKAEEESALRELAARRENNEAGFVDWRVGILAPVVVHPYFDAVNNALVFANLVVMMTEHSEMSKEETQVEPQPSPSIGLTPEFRDMSEPLLSCLVNPPR